MTLYQYMDMTQALTLNLFATCTRTLPVYVHGPWESGAQTAHSFVVEDVAARRGGERVDM